jgi:succinate dehydrogenase / fumarate reductase membrane anchor subunit
MTHPLARARGHGSAKSGVHHWLAQRISALLLLFLIPWLVYALVTVAGTGHAGVVSFVSRPWNATLLVLTLLVLLYHGMLGLQVVIEDYVPLRWLELLLHFMVRAGTLLAAALGVIHSLKFVFGV